MQIQFASSNITRKNARILFMKKILVLGAYGSGKTKFSSELGALLQIQVFHLDRYYWLSEWKVPTWKNGLQLIEN
jgi:uridine kinase